MGCMSKEGTPLMELQGASESASLAATAARRRRRTDGRRFQRQSPSFVATVDRRSREQMRCRAPGGCKGTRGGRTGRPVSAKRPTRWRPALLVVVFSQLRWMDGLCRRRPSRVGCWMDADGRLRRCSDLIATATRGSERTASS